jgi:hypothetical protein
MRIRERQFGLFIHLFIITGCSYLPGFSNGERGADAVIGHSSGDVTLFREGHTIHPGQGFSLLPSDIIETGVGSKLDLVIEEYGILKMAPESRIRFERLAEHRVRIVQMHGDLISMIERMDRSSSYSVVMPSLRADVRGTSFMTTVRPVRGGILQRVCVLTGAVAVGTETESVYVERGMQIELPEGEGHISPEMVRPLTQETLLSMQRLTVRHTSTVERYNTMIEEIRGSSPEIRMMAENGISANPVASPEGDRPDLAAKPDGEAVSQKDTKRDEPDRSSLEIKVEEGVFPQPEDAFR